MISQSKDMVKVSAGKKHPHRKKRLHDRGSRPTLTKIGSAKVRLDRVRGGNPKLRVLRTEVANVYDAKTKSFKKVAIKNVAENPANRHHARANIMGKGTLIETELGKARITNRPGQEGTVNAMLI